MTKRNFLFKLRKKLSSLPKKDIDERISFYSEMIDDRIEEGCTEREAVLDIGTVDEISAQIIADISPSVNSNKKVKTKRHIRAWEIVLLVLGSPIWLSLAVAAFAVVLSLYAVLWSLIISLWAVFAALAACGVGGIAMTIMVMARGEVLSGIAAIGASAICAGLAIFMCFACIKSTKIVISLTKLIFSWIAKCFVREE